MSSALRLELKSELEALDQRHGDKSQKLPGHSRKNFLKKLKKYRANVKVEEIAKEFSKSEEDQISSKKAKVQANIEKLLKLSSKSGTNKISVDPLIEQLDNSKRYYEPKGRTLLKKKPKKKSLEGGDQSLFTDKDFEDFGKEYFLNSKPVAKTDPKGKKKKKRNAYDDEDLD